MKFGEFKYERVEIEPLPEQLLSLEKRLADAGSADELIAAYKELNQLKSKLSTMSALAYIRHTIDTRDEFYRKEQDYYDINIPAVEEVFTRIGRNLLGSAYRKELESEIGSLAMRNIEIYEKAISPEIIGDMQLENALSTEYQALTASAQIDFNGEKSTISQIVAYQENPDRAVREAAFRAEGGFYASHKEKLDEIYDKMVKQRTLMAKKLGFESYTEMAYCLRIRNCYGRKEVETFREQVVEYIVPMVSEIMSRRNIRCGIEQAKYWDRKLMFKDGNPVPKGTPEEIFEGGRKMYNELSSETGEFMNFMLEADMFDVLSKEGKANGGYCSGLADFKAPFVFANFNGTQGDINVLTHECGHAFEGYVGMRTMQYLDQMEYSSDVAEIHSMSMEHFTYPWMEMFFKEDTAKYYYNHLADTLLFWPYGSMVDHFQHDIYDNPGLSPDERNANWKRLEALYRPDADFADLPHYKYGGMWQRQLHIYQYPFYYIDYCLAQYAAVCFWIMMNKDRQAAWNTYLELVRKAGTKDYLTLIKEAGFASPFEKDSLRSVSQEIMKHLDSLESKL